MENAQAAAQAALIKHLCGGALGPAENLVAGVAHLWTIDSTSVFAGCLEPLDEVPSSIRRYTFEIDHATGTISQLGEISLPDIELQNIMTAATGESFATAERFIDGSLSISYKVTTRQRALPYIVQMQHHGIVSSMDTMMRYVRENDKANILRVPTTYPIPGEAQHQDTTGFGRQIMDFVPGVIASSVYPSMPHQAKLALVRKLALAGQVCWNLPSPSPKLIGELRMEDNNGEFNTTIKAARQWSLGGPFRSVRDSLKASIDARVKLLDEAQGIDTWKDLYQSAIEEFVKNNLHLIPETVDECPIVLLHNDMGLHNVILFEDDHTIINGVINWEFCASAPFLSVHDMIERLFRQQGDGVAEAEFERATELREAFWSSIPVRRAHAENQSGKDFLHW